MNLLIVDDEPQIRKWIEQLVRKTGLDELEIRGMCSNGKEALAVCAVEPVDVVITDIKMPVMDGIELIRRLKEEFPSVQSIIMSSYSEFQYASEALKSGASDYILKAEVTADEFRETLRKVQAELALKKDREEEVYSLKSTINNHYYALRSLYLTELIHGKPAALREFRSKMDTFRLRLDDRNLIVMAISLDDYRNAIRSAKIRDQGLLESAMINIIDETLLTEGKSGCSLVYGPNLFVALVNSHGAGSRSARESTLYDATRIVANLTNFLHVSASVGISLPYGGLDRLGVQFQEACEALNRKRFYGKRSIAWHNEDTFAGGGLPDKAASELMDAASQLMNQSHYPEAMGKVRALMDKIETDKHRTEQEVKALSLEIVLMLQQALRRKEASPKRAAAYEPDVAVHRELGELSTFEQVKTWLFDRMEQLIRETEARKQPYTTTIQKVIAFMEAAYMEGISLQQAADVAHLNKTYLSELFKKETGISFNDYLTQIRIEKAKELLRSGEDTVSMLAERVGYPDGSYLTKVFKKLTGMTPLEYRQASLIKH
ncbi:Helix-turn-helix domain-containing protein [Paenibacillus sp. UNCCL117]|uniref:response regulator n=1 Tax=unclassified Paenibacillus TaxID=185978 RepID=UPI0008814D2A|nr:MULTISPECIES: response regulator [unclassified Paenibacillus]SDE07441.1 Helix-turn-helix domain-containing protein [Paenibacillus sp. cl123]SFW59171.1 Helix-turn-helix domain-containing protein [Paenibacillus sp. UNCCL117]